MGRRRRAGARTQRRGARAGLGPRFRCVRRGRELDLHLGSLAGDRGDAVVVGRATSRGVRRDAQRHVAVGCLRDGGVRVLPVGTSTPDGSGFARHRDRALLVVPSASAARVRQPVRGHAEPAHGMGPAHRNSHHRQRRRPVVARARRAAAAAHGLGRHRDGQPLRRGPRGGSAAGARLPRIRIEMGPRGRTGSVLGAIQCTFTGSEAAP